MTNEPHTVDNTKKSRRKAREQRFGGEESIDISYLLPLSSIVRVPRNLRKILQKKNSSISTSLSKQQKDAACALPTDKIQKLRSVLVENRFPSISVKRSLSKELGLPYHQVSTWFKHAVYHKREVSGLGRNSSLEETFSKGLRTDPRVDETTENEQLSLVEIERLFSLQERIQKLKNTLLTCKDYGQMPNKTHPKEPNVVCVPVVGIKEKPLKHIDT